MRDMDRRAWSFVSVILAGSALAGCASTAQNGNLQVKMLAATSQTPSNVAVNLSVGTKSGEPLTGLKPENFRIFEDGKLVPEDKAKRMLLDPKVAEAYFTVLLIDLSGPITESQDFPELVRQVGDFMDALRDTHTLTVSVFDGRDDLRTILEPDETNTKAALDRLRRYRPEERKGNLNGAVLKGLAILDRQLAKSTAAHSTSNLVVFTDRGDEAGQGARGGAGGRARQDAGRRLRHRRRAGDQETRARKDRAHRRVLLDRPQGDGHRVHPPVQAPGGRGRGALPALVLLAQAQGRARSGDRDQHRERARPASSITTAPTASPRDARRARRPRSRRRSPRSRRRRSG